MQCKNYGSFTLSGGELPSHSNSYIPEAFYRLSFLFHFLIPIAASNLRECTRFFSVSSHLPFILRSISAHINYLAPSHPKKNPLVRHVFIIVLFSVAVHGARSKINASRDCTFSHSPTVASSS